MNKGGLQVTAALNPDGFASASISTIGVSVDWFSPSILAYLDEDPKNKAPTEWLMVADAVALSYIKALTSSFPVADDDYRIIEKVLGDWEEVYTGENLLFYVDWVREFSDLVESSDEYQLLVAKPFNESVDSTDLSYLGLTLPKSDDLTASDSNFLSTILPESDGVSANESSYWSASLAKSDSSDASDVFDRVVDFNRDFQHESILLDSDQFALNKPLQDIQSVIDQIIVGLLYEKSYFDEVKSEVWGDPLNFGTLGEYTVNHNEGGEFVYLEIEKPITTNMSTPSDAFDRVVYFDREFSHSVTSTESDNYSLTKPLDESVSQSDSYSDVITYLRTFASSAAPLETSAVALLTSQTELPGTLNNSIFNTLPLNMSDTVTQITEYTLI
jgi:hypothetical protein